MLAADPTAAHVPHVEQELAFLADHVANFHVVELPETGDVSLLSLDSLVIDDLRGIELDSDPPILGEPLVPYADSMSDGLEPGTGPYVAKGILPFGFDHFDNQFSIGGWHNFDMMGYATAHGFNKLLTYNSVPADWTHLPPESQLLLLKGLGWPGLMLEQGLRRDDYDKLPPKDELVQLVNDVWPARYPDPTGYDLYIWDLEHPLPRTLTDQAAEGFKNTYLASLEAARSRGWPTVGLYGGGSAAQFFPRTWWGLENANPNHPDVTDRWDKYNREIVEAVDVVLPEVYSFYWESKNVAYTLANLDLNMQKFNSLPQPKPVVPFFWTRLHGGGGGWRWWRKLPMPQEDLRAMTSLSFFTGIDGLVTWDWSGTANHHTTLGDISPTSTVQVNEPFLAVTEDGRPDRAASRYDALYIRELVGDDQVRFQFVEKDQATRNHGVLPNIDLIGEWQFEDTASDRIRDNPVTISGGAFDEGRHGRAIRFDGDDSVAVHVNPAFSIEAESMTLTGMTRHDNADASGGALINRRGAVGNPPGRAETTFTGPDGNYNLTLSYFHENDGDSVFEIQNNGRRIAGWRAWGVDGTSDVPDAQSLRQSTLRDTYLRNGDVITLVGREDGGAYAAFDKVDIVPTTAFTNADPFSVSFWINLPADRAPEDAHIIGNTSGDGPGWQIRVMPDNTLAFVLHEDATTYNGVVTRTPIAADTWVQVTGVRGAKGSPTLHVDGKRQFRQLAGSTSDQVEFKHDGDIVIASGPDGSNGLEGAIDQLRIYKRNVTNFEAVALSEEGVHPVYVDTRENLSQYLRPKFEGISAQIEGLALIKPFEYFLKHGQVQIDVDARVQFRTSKPIVRRVSLGDYHLIATYNPNTVHGGAPAQIVLKNFDENPGLTLTLPADSQTRLFVVRLSEAPLITDVASSAAKVGHGAIGQAVTIQANFTDSDADNVHSATIDWGDGTITTGTVVQGSGFGSVAGAHDYAEAGRYTITTMVSDDEGHTDASSTDAFITGVAVHDGVLQVIGTIEADVVAVSPMRGDRIRVSADIEGVARGGIIVAAFDSIQMFLGAGNDRAWVSRRVARPALLDGGEGNDRLTGGQGTLNAGRTDQVGQALRTIAHARSAASDLQLRAAKVESHLVGNASVGNDAVADILHDGPAADLRRTDPIEDALMLERRTPESKASEARGRAVDLLALPKAEKVSGTFIPRSARASMLRQPPRLGAPTHRANPRPARL